MKGGGGSSPGIVQSIWSSTVHLFQKFPYNDQTCAERSGLQDPVFKSSVIDVA